MPGPVGLGWVYTPADAPRKQRDRVTAIPEVVALLMRCCDALQPPLESAPWCVRQGGAYSAANADVTLIAERIAQL